MILNYTRDSTIFVVPRQSRKWAMRMGIWRAAWFFGEERPLVTDIALAPGNVLIGKLVNGNRSAKTRQELVIIDMRAKQEISRLVIGHQRYPDRLRT